MKLGDIGTFKSGGTPSRQHQEYFGTEYPWITTVALGKIFIDENDSVNFISELGLQNSATKVIKPFSLMIGIRVGIGKCSINTVPMCTSQDIISIENISQDKFHLPFLALLINSKQEYLESQSRGATIQGITSGVLKEIDIPFFSLEEQKKIAEVLERVSDLILLRKNQLAKLDELVKSRFVEMFRDPNNTDTFSKKSGSILFDFSSGKFLEKEKRRQEGIPVYGGNGIAWFTSEPMINYHTIIIGRVGVYCGNINIVKEPVWITDNAIYIKKFKTNDFNIDFLYYLMSYLNFSQYAEVSGQPKITQKPLESTEYIVPPLALQNQFAAFVEQTENTKAAVKQSLDQLEILKKSLMQEFFG